MSIGLAGRNPEEYALRLAEAVPGTPYVFICPVCRKGFRTQRDARAGTCRAHIIPRALGGSKKTMVCRECDSAIGTRIEGPVLKLILDDRIAGGKRAGRIRNPVHIDTLAGRLDCSVSYDNKAGRRVRITGSPSAKRLLEEARRQVEPPRSAVVPMKYVYDKEKVNRTHELLLLKVAYYAGFEHLLYEYVLRPDLRWVGQLLLGEQGITAPYQFTLSVPQDRTDKMLWRDRQTGDIKPTATTHIDGTIDDEPAVFCYVSLHENTALVILPPREFDPSRLYYRSLRGPQLPNTTHTVSSFFGMTYD